MKKTATFSATKKNPIVVLNESNKVIYGDQIVDSLEVFYLATALTVQEKEKGVVLKMSYQTDDPSLSWFVIPTKENYYTTYTEWLKKQNCSEELFLRFEKTSMKLARTVTIKNKVFKVLIAAPHSVEDTKQLLLLEDSFGNVVLVNKIQTKLFFRIRRF